MIHDVGIPMLILHGLYALGLAGVFIMRGNRLGLLVLSILSIILAIGSFFL